MKNLTTLSLLLLAVNVSAQIKIPKEKWTQLYEQGRYKDVYSEALSLRKKEYGKSATVDFFIAKSLCAGGQKDKSIEWFDYILKNYKIEAESKKKIGNDRTSCARPNPSIADRGTFDLDILQTLASMETPESTSRGKGGSTSFDCDKSPESFITKYKVSEEELQSRLFALNESNAAISKFQRILGPDYQVKQSGRFNLITYRDPNFDNQKAQAVSQALQSAFNFYVSYYSLRPPDKLLTVCLLPSKQKLQETALKLHGIQIPSANWGYSNIADLTLLGWADKDHIGTLIHELFHLMIRTDIGDAPPWLDEGIASLYEQSQWHDNYMAGTVKNWRTEVLRKAYNSYELKSRIPRLKNFLMHDWDEFDGSKAGDICNVSINYAYGRNFIVYLQETQKLQMVFELMKSRTVIDPYYNLTTASSVEIVQRSFGLSIDEIENNFLKWLMPVINDRGTSNPSQGWVKGGQQSGQQQIRYQPTLQQEYETPQLTVSEILSAIEVHVWIDHSDQSGNAVAFNYYIQAPPEVLNNVKIVKYQRMDNTFSERKSGKFIFGTQANNNFGFKGYQWGSINYVLIAIETVDQQFSEAKEYRLIYD
ncbi:hypothetical protein SAMN04488029_1076 [Reichenbachiella faecimaris]|uniref:Peptidase MA superfamily protein n=1 Tax=Reichenbachiella faecimaris TaxID=692418 RepID=A0A1W2G7R5_REIFA|nr:hypothetical protein [Reichenbachiella faecimaris]SMD32725.1 hypothetical protein SAMN04488029_1076 [Reichenbachiella faecimaris]